MSSPVCTEFRSRKGNSKHNESEQFNKEGDTRRADKEETAGWKSKKYQVLISAGGGLMMFAGRKDRRGGQQIDLHLINADGRT